MIALQYGATRYFIKSCRHNLFAQLHTVSSLNELRDGVLSLNEQALIVSRNHRVNLYKSFHYKERYIEL